MDWTDEEWLDKEPVKQVGSHGRWQDRKSKWAFNPETYARLSKQRIEQRTARPAGAGVDVNVDMITHEMRHPRRNASVPPPTVSSIAHDDDASWDVLSDLGYTESHVSAGFVRSFLGGNIDDLRQPGRGDHEIDIDEDVNAAATAARDGGTLRDGLLVGRDGNLIATDAGLGCMSMPQGDIDGSPSTIATSGVFPDQTNAEAESHEGLDYSHSEHVGDQKHFPIDNDDSSENDSHHSNHHGNTRRKLIEIEEEHSQLQLEHATLQNHYAILEEETYEHRQTIVDLRETILGNDAVHRAEAEHLIEVQQQHLDSLRQEYSERAASAETAAQNVFAANQELNDKLDRQKRRSDELKRENIKLEHEVSAERRTTTEVSDKMQEWLDEARRREKAANTACEELVEKEKATREEMIALRNEVVLSRRRADQAGTDLEDAIRRIDEERRLSIVSEKKIDELTAKLEDAIAVNRTREFIQSEKSEKTEKRTSGANSRAGRVHRSVSPAEKRDDSVGRKGAGVGMSTPSSAGKRSASAGSVHRPETSKNCVIFR